jgi:flavin-dependent dehydrogenase
VSATPTAWADVVVVGGGPAGVAVALGAARRGLEVVLVDRARFPRDKPCGEGLLPTAVTALARLGLLAEVRRHAYRIDGVRFIVPGGPSAEHAFVDAAGAPAYGLGAQRRALDALLLDAARAEPGVTVLEGVEAVGVVRRGDGAVCGLTTTLGPIGARVVVGADGLRSRVRALIGLDAQSPSPSRLGLRLHFDLGDGPELPRCVRVLVAPDVEYYLTPVARRRLQVAVLGSQRAFARIGLSAASVRAHVQGQIEGLDGARAVAVDRPLGAGPLRQRTRGVVRDGALLCGDAAGYVDAITGEGIGLALAGGLAAAEALAAAAQLHAGREPLPARALAGYARAHRALVRDADRLTALVLACAARPWLARRAVAVLDRHPALFAHLLAVQAGGRLRPQGHLRILMSR